MKVLGRVADLAEQVRGVTYDKGEASASPRAGYLPVLRAGNITDDGLVFDDLVFVPAGRVSEKQKVRRNDVLIAASSGSLGVVGKAARALANYDGGFGAFCKVLRPGPSVDPGYFAHFFRTPEYRQRVSALAAGININNLRNEHLDGMLIPLPPLAEQQRIAAILDKADELRAKRRAATAQLDALAKSLFLDMFGDPATNPKEWPLTSLENRCVISGEYGAGVASRPFQPGLPRYVRITDVMDGGDLNDDPVSPAGSRSDWGAYELAPGDVLFARSGATVGKAYMHRQSDGPCVFAGYMIRFRPDLRKLFPEYLFAFTRTDAYRRWVAARQRVVAQPNINAKQYSSELLIPLPPVRVQEAFAKKAIHIEKKKGVFRASQSRLDSLFFSLQNVAFGEAL